MQALEGLGQQPLDIGINIGAKGQSTAGANALLEGGMGAARSNFAANAYNPFATALVGASQNPQLQDALKGYFNRPPPQLAYNTDVTDPTGPFRY
jgi:hypothetical protein